MDSAYHPLAFLTHLCKWHCGGSKATTRMLCPANFSPVQVTVACWSSPLFPVLS